MQYTVDGVIVREAIVGDNDKMLTIITPESGRISVMAKGARSSKSKTLAATQLYTYGNYEIYEKGDHKWLRGASAQDSFFEMRNTIEGLSLAAYLADLAYELTGEGEDSSEMLRLTLNAFYAIAKKKAPLPIIKGVYELRSASREGFRPDLSGCRHFRSGEEDKIYLDVMNGCVICSQCMRKRAAKQTSFMTSSAYAEENEEKSLLLPITPSVLAAMRYAVDAPLSRMLSFKLDGADETDMFSRAAEEYLLNHLERGFASLEFYKSMI